MWTIKLELHQNYVPGTVLEQYTSWYVIALYYYWVYSGWYWISIYPIKRILMYKTVQHVVKLNSVKQISEGNFKQFRNKRSG